MRQFRELGLSFCRIPWSKKESFLSNRKTKNRTEERNTIELAILNGIEAFNREQAKKNEVANSTAQKRVQKSAHAEKNVAVQSSEQAANPPRGDKRSIGKKSQPESSGELTTKENMEDSSKRRSRTKGKGTKLPEKKSENSLQTAKLVSSTGGTAIRQGMSVSAVKKASVQKADTLIGGSTEIRQETIARAVSVKQGAPRQAAALALADKIEEQRNEVIAAKARKEAQKKELLRETVIKYKKGRKKLPVKILFFGGVGEIGKNMTAIEYGNDIIVIDAGVIFPTEDMPGIDLVFPDITYLVQNKDKIRGIFLTHGHEDHIGGVPYLMKELDPNTPVYGTKLTLALTDNKLREHKMNSVRMLTVAPKEKVKAGAFTVNFINVNHSIAGALALAIETPYGVIFHSGDFKIDLTPVAGSPIDLTEIAEYGKRGVLLYLGESTNIERPGYTMSETVVGTTLEHLFSENADRRLIIATFASNVHRLQQIIDIAVKYRRKVALSGRSMLNVVDAALKIGELTIPEGVLVDVEKTKNYFDKEIVIVSTGSQGEPMSALTRMASGEFNKITIGSNDTIIISASPIPGNERMIYRVINKFFKLGANVVYESLEKIHVSGHACQEEHKIMHTLLKPKFFIPVHGEYRHLKRHALLAEELGMPQSSIFIPDIGGVAEITEDSLKQGESFQAGARLIDGEGFEDLATGEVLKDRLRMSGEGVFVLSVVMSRGVVIGEPVIESRGFVFSGENDLSELKEVVDKTLSTNGVQLMTLRDIASYVKRAMQNFLYKKTKQSPMIITMIREI